MFYYLNSHTIKWFRISVVWAWLVASYVWRDCTVLWWASYRKQLSPLIMFYNIVPAVELSSINPNYDILRKTCVYNFWTIVTISFEVSSSLTLWMNKVFHYGSADSWYCLICYFISVSERMNPEDVYFLSSSTEGGDIHRIYFPS